MKEWQLQGWWCTALRVVMGVVFIYAGTVKMASPQDFADSIATFQILPAWAINGAALWLPVLEIGLGGMLILGFWKRTAILGILLLLAVFTLALGQALLRGLPVDCGCFGSNTPSVWKEWMALTRDTLLFAGALLLYQKIVRLQQHR